MAELVSHPNEYAHWNYTLNDGDSIVAGLKATHNGNGMVKIYNVEVKEELRGRGFGVELMTKLVELAKQRKVCSLWLWVSKDNSVAIHVYEKVGFSITKEHTHTYDMEMFL